MTAGFAARRLILLQLLIWTTYGVIRYAAALPAILPEERNAMAIANAVRALTGLAVSTLVVPLLEWRRYLDRGMLIVIAALAAPGAGFGWMFADRAVLVTVAAFLDLTIPWVRFVHGMDLEYLFVMLAWTTAYVALMLFERGRKQHEEFLRQEVHLHQTRLSLLATQLNPHFLFNSLNTIRSLAAEDPGRTREVVSRLSSFLRRVLSVDSAMPVPLEQEVDLARDYLAVEQARLESGLQVAFDIDPGTRGVVVPALILQPLLENAIKHGDADSDGIRHILVRAEMADDLLLLSIRNSGSLLGRVDGTGLKLTRARLEQMYGSGYRLGISNEGADTVARLDLPLTGREDAR